MNQAPFRCSTRGQAPGLPRKHQTRLAILARDIHSSLLRKPMNYEQKKFVNIGPRTQCIKTLNARNLRMFVPGRPFQLRLIFESKSRTYLSETPFGCSTIGQAPALTHKHQSRLKEPARNTHSSLFVNYGRKKLYNIGPRTEVLNCKTHQLITPYRSLRPLRN